MFVNLLATQTQHIYKVSTEKKKKGKWFCHRQAFMFKQKYLKGHKKLPERGNIKI